MCPLHSSFLCGCCPYGEVFPTFWSSTLYFKYIPGSHFVYVFACSYIWQCFSMVIFRPLDTDFEPWSSRFNISLLHVRFVVDEVMQKLFVLLISSLLPEVCSSLDQTTHCHIFALHFAHHEAIKLTMYTCVKTAVAEKSTQCWCLEDGTGFRSTIPVVIWKSSEKKQSGPVQLHVVLC